MRHEVGSALEAGVRAAAQRALGSLGQSGASERLRTAAALSRGADSVDLSEAALAAGGRGGDLSASLAQISTLLEELEAVASGKAQGDIDALVSQIQQAAAKAPGDPVSTAGFARGYEVLNGGPDIGELRAHALAIGEGEDVEISALVTASAQTGSLKLSFGNTALDLGAGSADEEFTIEVAGPRGSRTLSFVSGISILDIAATVNAFTEDLGVSASISGTGVRLDSQEFGADAFVSVRVVNAPPGIVGDGVLTYDDRNSTTAGGEGSDVVSFADAAAGVADAGQDVRGTVNGYEAVGEGRTLRVRASGFEVDLELSIVAAQSEIGSETSPFLVRGLGPSAAIGQQAQGWRPGDTIGLDVVGAVASLGLFAETGVVDVDFVRSAQRGIDWLRALVD